MTQICANCKYWNKENSLRKRGAYHECTKHHFNTDFKEYAEFTITESSCDDFEEKGK